jgi:hypothetical protein
VRSNRRFRTLILLALAATLMSSAFTRSTSGAFVNNNCRWVGFGAHPTIYYFNTGSVTDFMRFRTSAGAWRWSSSSAHIDFIPTTHPFVPVYVAAEWHGGSFPAFVETSGCPGGLLPVGTRLVWNSRVVNNGTGVRFANATAAHEFGHLSGLDHPGQNTCALNGAPGAHLTNIMAAGYAADWAEYMCGYPPGPYPDDINGSNTYYP